MLTITKQEARKLKDLASKLPITTYDTPKMGTVTDGENVWQQRIGDRMYKVNHGRRIIDCYKSGGMDLVKTYCREVMELDKIASTPIILNSNPPFAL